VRTGIKAAEVEEEPVCVRRQEIQGMRGNSTGNSGTVSTPVVYKPALAGSTTIISTMGFIRMGTLWLIIACHHMQRSIQEPVNTILDLDGVKENGGEPAYYV